MKKVILKEIRRIEKIQPVLKNILFQVMLKYKLTTVMKLKKEEYKEVKIILKSNQMQK